LIGSIFSKIALRRSTVRSRSSPRKYARSIHRDIQIGRAKHLGAGSWAAVARLALTQVPRFLIYDGDSMVWHRLLARRPRPTRSVSTWSAAARDRVHALRLPTPTGCRPGASRLLPRTARSCGGALIRETRRRSRRPGAEEGQDLRARRFIRSHGRRLISIFSITSDV
jgi:hypothetical protein